MKLHNEDCIIQMQKMIDEGVQVDSVVTDPPYELGFMGKSWDSTGIAFQKETWELAFQLLKSGGHLLAFAGSRTYHRIAVAVEDAGFEIRDQLMWLYGSGFPKSMNIGKGWGTALKPAHEPVVMARKPIKGTVADNVLKHGTGGINIDDCRIDLSEGDDPRLGGKGTWKTDKMAKDVYVGGYAGEDQGSSELGRFPANVMHDGSEEVLKGFPNTKSIKGKPRTATIKNQTRLNNSQEVFVNNEYEDEGSAARFFYCPKVSKNERNRGLGGFEEKEFAASTGAQNKIKDEKNYDKSQSFGMNKIKKYRNTHPTVKPIELMKYLCRLVTPKGGIVLDPFMGSGSTGMAAKDEGFDFVGIEREKEYFEIAETRINASSPLLDFFE